MTDFHRIGVWQTAFLGDAVLTLPLLAALHSRYPNAEIHLWVRTGLEPLFAAQPGVHAVHGFDKRGKDKCLFKALRLGKQIQKHGFDLWISPHRSFRSALVAKATGIPTRIGYDTPWFNRMAYTTTVPRRFAELEEIERLHQLLAPLNISLPAPKAQLHLPVAAKERAESFWQEKGLAGDRVLGVHPGSTWPTKCWLPEYFANVIRRAAEQGTTVLVFGGPQEAELVSDIIERAGGTGRYVHDLSAHLSLEDLAALIGKLDACLTNDSGPMHLAWTQGIPLVSLFGPTVKSLGFFPRGENSTVLETELSCRPCGLHGPKRCPRRHHNCMKKITPSMVWDALAPTLNESP